MTDLALTPDWTVGIKESYDFLTEVFTSRSGIEQRRAMRQRPRMSIGFSALLTHDYLRKFQRDKLTAAGGLVRCGRWAYQQYETVSASGTTIVISTSDTIAAGDYCIYRSFEVEYFTVSSAVTADPWSSGYDAGFGPVIRILTLSTALTGDWSAGGTIVPVVDGRLGTQSPFTAITDSVVTAEVTLTLEPGTYAAPFASGMFPMLDGIEILSLRPDWNIAQQQIIEYPYETVDYTIGIIKTYAPVNYLNRIMSPTFSILNRPDADKLVGLFSRMKGRLGEFYCPTWMNDMPPRTSIASGDTSIYVQTSHTFDDLVHRAILVVLKSGAVYAAKITDVENPPDSELGPAEFSDAFASVFDTGAIGSVTRKLILEDPFPLTLLLNEIDRICWMPLCRFASDQLVVNRITDTVSQITANIISLETP